jgi:hypothetical protein
MTPHYHAMPRKTPVHHPSGHCRVTCKVGIKVPDWVTAPEQEHVINKPPGATIRIAAAFKLHHRTHA